MILMKGVNVCETSLLGMDSGLIFSVVYLLF